MSKRDAALAILALAVAPLVCVAQTKTKVWRIGYLSLAARPDKGSEIFRGELRSLGYVEGRNLLIVFRWAADNVERMKEHADELIQ